MDLLGQAIKDAVDKAGLTLDGLGIQPQGIEAIVPAYLVRFRRAGQFTRPDAER